MEYNLTIFINQSKTNPEIFVISHGFESYGLIFSGHPNAYHK